jgi:PAS domain S-box-containing protein
LGVVQTGSLDVLVVAADEERATVLADALAATADSVDAVDPGGALAAADDDVYDCVVVEQELGDTTGVRLVELLAQTPLPVVFSPVGGDEALARDALRAGADDYVPRTAPEDTAALGDRLVRTVREHTNEDQALRDLNAAARELTLAETPAEVCERATETARDVLGFDITAAFLADDDESVLEPAAWTDAADELFDGLSALPAGDSLAWDVYRSGSLQVYGDLSRMDGRHNPETPVESELIVPLGEFGVLVSGATSHHAFDEYDVELVRLLAQTTEAALQRTEREATLRARERELEDYETVFETVRDRVYVLDEDGCFRLVNDPLCELIGYDREELLGEPVAMALADPDSAAGIREQMEAMLAEDVSDPTVTVESRVRTADGDTVPVEAEIAPFPSDDGTFTGSVGVIRDVSDRKAVEAALEAERSRLSRLFQYLPDPVVRVTFEDGEPVVQSVNDSFESTFGYPADEIVGESLNEYVVPADETEAAAALDDRAEEGEYPRTEVRRQTADGIRHFLFRGVPVEAEDGALEGFGIYTDITDQKTRERRLQVLNRVLRHNLRNEMNVVIGNADMIASDGADRDDVERRAREIVATASDVADMGERVRQLERALDRTGVGVVDVTELVRETLDPYRDRDDVAVETDLPASLRVAAGDLLGVALDDIVENALDHHDGDRPSVAVSACEVDGWVEVSVADDGPGIPDEEVAVLDDDEEITQLTHGSGLGLWLVDWLVTSLGGEVRFETNDPRGTVVTLRLPAAE